MELGKISGFCCFIACVMMYHDPRGQFCFYHVAESKARAASGEEGPSLFDNAIGEVPPCANFLCLHVICHVHHISTSLVISDIISGIVRDK